MACVKEAVAEAVSMVLAASARDGGHCYGLLALWGRSSILGRDGGLVVPGLGGGPRQTRIGAHYRALLRTCHCLKVQQNFAWELVIAQASPLFAAAGDKPFGTKKQNPVAWTGPRVLVAGTGFEPVTFGL